MRPTFALLPLILATGLTGCATVEGAGFVASLSPGVRRGEAYAEQVCSQCHAIGRNLSSPVTDATPFSRMMTARYNLSALRSELEAINEVGHYNMPRVDISPLQIDDLVAYIDSVN